MDQIRPEIVLAILAGILVVVLLIARLAGGARKPAPPKPAAISAPAQPAAPSPRTASPSMPAPSAPAPSFTAVASSQPREAPSYAAAAAAYASANPCPAPPPASPPRIDYANETISETNGTSYAAVAVATAARAR
jgi:hypothetical protein